MELAASLKATEALTAYVKANTEALGAGTAFVANVLTAKVSYAAARYR